MKLDKPNLAKSRVEKINRKRNFVHHVGLLRVDCRVVVVGNDVGDGVEVEQVGNEQARRCRTQAAPPFSSVHRFCCPCAVRLLSRTDALELDGSQMRDRYHG